MIVWTIYNNGSYDEEVFKDDQEGMNYAKDRSLRAMVVFTANSRNQFEAYEHGNMTTVNRKKKLSSHVEEMIMSKMDKEYKQFRGRRSVTKQQ